MCITHQAFILVVPLFLFCSCVSHRDCHVAFAPDHTDVEVSKDWYGLVPGICGFTSHAGYGRSFRMLGQKAEYHGDEIQEIPAKSDAIPYEGSITILRDQRRVVMKLSQRGYDKKQYPFELNGRYHYH